MKPAQVVRICAAAGAIAAIAAGARFHRGWGATPQEQASEIPGDNFVKRIKFRSTRAITIDAPPQAVWPWLAQMGMGRGGWYANDKALQLISPVSTASATRIIDDLQDLKVGDAVDLILSVAVKGHLRVPHEVLVLVADENQRPLQPWVKSWAFQLRPLPGGATRLIVRETSGWDSWLVHAVTAATGWLWFLGARRQLKNIKALVEAT
ncbi:MAG: hypothetical protein LBD97_02280 [Bifidobacteriaceae bacterium]|jgi:hypothetical protein|nr:hypothetical protein [Bifidobacteriaceae bacterium]